MKKNKCNNINEMRPIKEHDVYYKMLKNCGILFYNKFNKNFIKINCPSCDKNVKSKLFTKYGFSHYKCSQCNTLFCSPRPTEENLIEYYEKFESALYLKEILLKTDMKRKIIQHRPRVDMIVKTLKKFFCENILTTADIGAGVGAFSQCLKDSNFFKKVIAFDFNKECIDICIREGIESYRGSIDQVDDSSIGLLTMNDLLEHLFCPLSFLKKCYSKIIKNGMIFISAPNGEGFDFQILGKNTVNLTPPEHLNYFNPYSVKILLERSGFKIIKIETPGILDVEIVMREINNNSNILKYNKFLKYLLYETYPQTLKSFQNFLIKNLLSSHMIIMAQKI
jgi:2-polyprenyl-3-methyl-5-hydroxy-6-metoxy-1,4-benzoquinol methylase